MTRAGESSRIVGVRRIYYEHYSYSVEIMEGDLMKKAASAVLGALLALNVTGHALAAENPFSDVPADHWARDAVQQLARDGVINGYGDETYRGDRNITRFEMAQMVAKAMAKEDVSAANKALIDKLAAEFHHELDSLGVRVAKLEKHADKVKLNGRFRYIYVNNLEEDDGIKESKRRTYGTLRLEPSMEIDEHWSGHARVDYHFDMKHDVESTALTRTQVSQNTPQSGLKRAWVQGDYKNFQVLFGKVPYISKVDNGMIYDETVSGIQLTYGSRIKATVTAGRSSRFDSVIEKDATILQTGSYQAVEVYNDRADRFTWGLAFHRWSNREALYVETGVRGINIYEVGLGYKFNKNLSLNGAYAWTNAPIGEHETVGVSDPVSNTSKHAYSIELDYKKANPADKGSFGAFIAYRRLGHYASIAPTYDTIRHGEKGVEFGVDYVIAKNVMATAKYFLGKKMPDEDGVGEHLQSAKTFYGELSFFF